MNSAFKPSEMSRGVYPREVQYRLAVGQGLRCVNVLLGTSEPRIMAWSERWTVNTREVQPMSLALGEIEEFVQDARRTLGV